MGIVSLLVLGWGAKDLGKLRLTQRYLNFEGLDSKPRASDHLTREQRLLLYGDPTRSGPAEQWKALWESRHEHPPYFIEYANHYIGEHDSLPPDFLAIAGEIDPDNGIYLAVAAALEAKECLSKGSTSGIRREDRKPTPYVIDDTVRQEGALELLRQATSKPRLTCYTRELLEQRIPLMPVRKDFASQLPAIAMVAGQTTLQMRLIPVSNLLASEIQRCGKEEDREGYQSIKRLSRKYYGRVATDGCLLVEPVVAKASMTQGFRSFRDSAVHFGLSEESEAFEEIDLTLRPPEPGRGRRPDPEENEIEKLIGQKGGLLHALSLPMLHRQILDPVPITEDDLTPGRRTDHALLGRISSFAAWGVLGLALSAVALYRYRSSVSTRFLSARLRRLLLSSDWFWILGLGIGLPLLWYVLIGQLSPLAAHAWNMRASGFVQPAGQMTSTIWMLLITPVVAARWRLSKRIPFLNGQVRHSWLGWIAVIGLALVTPLLGAMFLLEGHGTNLMFVAAAAICFAQLWLLVVALRALFGKQRLALSRQTVALCLIPAYVSGMLLVILAAPLFYKSESKWIQRDWLLEVSAEEPSMGRYEYRVTKQLQSELAEILERFPR